MPKWLVVRLILFFRGGSYHHPVLVHMQGKVQAIFSLLNTSITFCLQCRAFGGEHERSADRPPPVLRAVAWLSGDHRCRVPTISGQQPPLPFRHWCHGESHVACHLGELSRNTNTSTVHGQFQAYPTLQEDRVPAWGGFNSEESKVKRVDRYRGLCKSGVTGSEESSFGVCSAVTNEPTSYLKNDFLSKFWVCLVYWTVAVDFLFLLWIAIKVLQFYFCEVGPLLYWQHEALLVKGWYFRSWTIPETWMTWSVWCFPSTGARPPGTQRLVEHCSDLNILRICSLLDF